MYRQRADGSGQPERLLRDGDNGIPETSTPDAAVLLFSATGPFRLMALTLATQEMRPVGETQNTTPFQATLSPDGRWLAYQVSGGGASTAFVEPYPPTGEKYEVPHRAEAGHPVWMHGGKALLFEDGGRHMLIDVQTAPSFRFGQAREFPTGGLATTIATSARNHDVMPDGLRLVGVVGGSEQAANGPTAATAREIDVVLNWTRALTPNATPR